MTDGAYGNQDAYILATDDGTLFLCSAEPIGVGDKVHWVFTDKDQRRYIGPPWIGVLYEAELRTFLNAWWHNTKILAQETGDLQQGASV
jgi:hypothetical protein